jgi:hypothetical protein
MTNWVKKTNTGKIILSVDSGTFKNITDSDIPFKLNEDLYIENINIASKIAVMNDINISFNDNYFLTARWQRLGEIWLSNYGHTFSISGLSENATDLQNYKTVTIPNGQKRSLWPAGEYQENSYWFDSTTGTLFKYIVSIDRLNEIGQIFIGPDDYATGNTLAPAVNPIWINDILYFHDSGSIKTYNPITGNINIFAIDQKIWKWN